MSVHAAHRVLGEQCRQAVCIPNALQMPEMGHRPAVQLCATSSGAGVQVLSGRCRNANRVSALVHPTGPRAAKRTHTSITYTQVPIPMSDGLPWCLRLCALRVTVCVCAVFEVCRYNSNIDTNLY